MLKLQKLWMVALVAAFCLSCLPAKVRAQVEEKKFEVGVQFATQQLCVLAYRRIHHRRRRAVDL